MTDEGLERLSALLDSGVAAESVAVSHLRHIWSEVGRVRDLIKSLERPILKIDRDAGWREDAINSTTPGDDVGAMMFATDEGPYSHRANDRAVEFIYDAAVLLGIIPADPVAKVIGRHDCDSLESQ